MQKQTSSWLKRFIGFCILGVVLLIGSQLIKYFLIKNNNLINTTTFNNISWIGLKIQLNENILWNEIQINDFVTIIILQSFVVFILSIWIFLWRKKQISCILILIWVGGMGNLINRLWYNPFVIDYFFVKIINAIYFNLEDVMIVFGCLTLLVFLVTNAIKLMIRRNKKTTIHKSVNA